MRTKTYSAKRRKSKKKTLMERDGSHCYWCRKTLTLKTATFEHIVPHSRGGSLANDNLVLACQPCNLARGNMTFEAYENLCRSRILQLAGVA